MIFIKIGSFTKCDWQFSHQKWAQKNVNATYDCLVQLQLQPAAAVKLEVAAVFHSVAAACHSFAVVYNPVASVNHPNVADLRIPVP